MPDPVPTVAAQLAYHNTRANIARAQGLAEAIRDLNPHAYSLNGVRQIASEIVELLKGVDPDGGT